MTDSLLDLEALLDSWRLAMRAERKSANTLRIYTAGVMSFLRWCDDAEQPREITRTAVQAFVADMIDAGAEPATALVKQKSVRQFSAWLTAEGEFDDDPLLGIKPVKLDTKVVDALTDDELKAMLKACAGKELSDRRDEAILRLMLETGIRAGEVIDMKVSDVDVQRGLATVYRGKGGKGRVAPFGPQTATALDRYLRARRTHRLAANDQLWLGARGKGLGYWGLRRSLAARAETAGIEGFHPHLLRHTAATRWLRAGGSEQGLMAVAGWSTRAMLDRYTSASASERAASEARGLNLGDL